MADENTGWTSTDTRRVGFALWMVLTGAAVGTVTWKVRSARTESQRKKAEKTALVTLLVLPFVPP